MSVLQRSARLLICLKLRTWDSRKTESAVFKFRSLIFFHFHWCRSSSRIRPNLGEPHLLSDLTLVAWCLNSFLCFLLWREVPIKATLWISPEDQNQMWIFNCKDQKLWNRTKVSFFSHRLQFLVQVSLGRYVVIHGEDEVIKIQINLRTKSKV